MEHHLKELKLAGFMRGYRRVSGEGAQEGCDYAGFLLRLAERELLDRERRASRAARVWYGKWQRFINGLWFLVTSNL